ncbi:MAG: ATP-binding protein [Spirochaetaceae bacterium]|nr:MAG: ATP-binding protein [Spirochaetaceae bacterium]
MIQGRENPQDTRLRERLALVRHRVAVMSGKGGVGKSTVSANLAWGLARAGRRVGLLDTDIHGPNLPLMLGISDVRFSAISESEIEPVAVSDASLPGTLHVASVANIGYGDDTALIWRGPMKLGLIKQFLADVAWGELDYLVIDTPPGTGDEALTIGQFIKPMTGIVIVTTPQEVALLDARKSVDFAAQMKIPVIGIVENMADSGDVAVFGSGGGERAARELEMPFLGRIGMDPRIVTCGDGGRVFLAEYPDSPAGEQFSVILEGITTWCERSGKDGA